MRLVDLIPDPDTLCAFESDELGLRMLPTLANMGGFLNLERALDIWVGRQYPGEYPRSRSHAVEEAIREAWAWLEGVALLVPLGPNGHTSDDRRLSRRARHLAQESNPRKAFGARLLPKDVLHPRIREDVWQLYLREKYDQAVLVAMKAVEVAVRDAAQFSAEDYGTDMIARAFNEKTGCLRDTGAQLAERIALRNLFVGAHGSYKNPHSHRNIPLDDAHEAAEIIMLANHLLRIVDSRRKANGGV